MIVIILVKKIINEKINAALYNAMGLAAFGLGINAVVRNMPEHSRFLRGMFSWVGFKQTALPYDRDARYAGETHYPLKKMIRLALDGIIGFSIKPLKISFYTGFIWAFLGFLTAFILLILLCFGISGGLWWLASLGMVLTGNILICLGIAGEYIGRTFEDARNRPLYVVAATCNLDDHV